MAGKHRARPRTETSDYVAMMTRLISAWGDRVAADPAALVHLRDLHQQLTDATNRGMFEANRGQARYSHSDMAAILGVSRQAVAKRIGLGELVYAAAAAARGAGPVVRLADVRRARAAGLASAGVADVTGTERERRAV
ncbi:MAG TPA: hypothetical protein VGI05_26685 [Streptosporangiaceae bacterium]|jgi:hypothetical protein